MGRRLFNNNWFVRIVSLFFAILLTISVSDGNANSSALTQTNTSTSTETSVTISNVPVVLGEHDEGTFVSGLPETVSVRLTGPRNIINQLSIENFSVSTESLVGIETGVRAIRLTATGLPDTVEYKITPDIFYGTISRKETEEWTIEYEFSDTAIASGYRVTSVLLDPEVVTLTGADTEMNKVDRVLVQIAPSTAQSEAFTQAYRVQILDSQGNPLDINVSQETIDVRVEIVPVSNSAILNIVPIGENDNYSYTYQLLGSEYVEVSSDVSSISSVNLIVDVAELDQSATVTGYVEIPNGATVSPTTVEVQVSVTPLEEATNETANLEETTTQEQTEEDEE